MKHLLHSGIWYWRHLKKQYKAEECDAVKFLLRPEDVCIDVGAHAGSWTLPLCRLVLRGHVHAFEALPHYAKALKGLAALCRLKNLTIYNSAVSDQSGRVEIAWRTKQGRKLTGNTHMAIAGETDKAECVSVPATTLDDWALGTPNSKSCVFIKIDVEGAELLVLRGASHLIRQNRPAIFMEVVTDCCARYDYTPAMLFEHVAGMDYDAFTVEMVSGSVILRSASAANYSGKGDILILPRERAISSRLQVVRI